MHKAFGYSSAWLLSYGVNILSIVIGIATSGNYITLKYITYIFVPLQGFFNLLIYMYPKVIYAKKSRKRGDEDVSWCQAICTAFWSRGNAGKRKGVRGTVSNLRGYRHPKRNNRGDHMRRLKPNQLIRGLIKNKKPERETQEEEKQEIQPLNHVTPHKEISFVT